MSFFERFKDRSDAGRQADEQAIARYRYLVRTAPPEAIEEAHAEAFARLSPEQRRRLLAGLAGEIPAAERAGDAPGVLARVATRAEMREPGALERAWSRMGASAGPAGGPATGFGGMFASSLVGSLAGAVLGTAIAQNFFAAAPAGALGGGADGAAAPADAGHLGDDPWTGLDSADADSGDFADLGGDFGGDTFDI